MRAVPDEHLVEGDQPLTIAGLRLGQRPLLDREVGRVFEVHGQLEIGVAHQHPVEEPR